MSVASQKRRSINADFSRRSRKNQLKPGQESMGMLHCCHTVLSKEILNRKRQVCWSIVMKEKPTDGSSFFGVLPSDRIP
jgi:hypothetical protein